MIPELRAFLDEGGRLTSLPSKYKKQLCAVWYLASKLEAGRVYTQEELGDALDRLHTFHDPATLRRSLVDRGLLERTRDGAEYRRLEEMPTLEEFVGRNI